MSTTQIPTARRNVDGMAIIGRTLHDLRGIRYEEGEGGAGDDAAAQAAAAAAAAADTDKAPWTKENFDPERAWRLTENLRTDLADQKAKTDAAIAAAAEKAEKNALAKIGRLLSGEDEPETDPEKLAAKVTDLSTQIASKDSEISKRDADIKARDISLQVALLAPTLGANTKLLLANEEFKTSIASAEPTDEAAITAAITKALQANAALKQPPRRTGDVDHTGPTVQSLQTQLAAAEKAGDHALAISLKRRISAAQLKAS